MLCDLECDGSYLIKLLVELIELGRFAHHIFTHEEWRLYLLIAASSEEIKPVVDHSLIQVDTIVCEEKSTVASNF